MKNVGKKNEFSPINRRALIPRTPSTPVRSHKTHNPQSTSIGDPWRQICVLCPFHTPLTVTSHSWVLVVGFLVLRSFWLWWWRTWHEFWKKMIIYSHMCLLNCCDEIQDVALHCRCCCCCMGDTRTRCSKYIWEAHIQVLHNH